MALDNKATALREAEQFPELIEAIDEIVARFGDTEEAALQTIVITSLVNKGVALHHLGDAVSAVATFQTALSRYGDCGTPDEQESLAAALFNIGVGLTVVGDHQGAISAYEALDRDFGDTQDEQVQHCVSQGLVNLGVVLRRDMDDAQRAIRVYDRVLDRFGQTEVARIRRQVAMALSNRGVAQRDLGEYESALASWNELSARFSPALDRQTHDLVASARVHTAMLLAGTGEFERARRTLKDFLEEFDKVEDPRVQMQLGRALNVLCAVEIHCGRPEGALEPSERLEREFGELDHEFVWRARCHSTRAHLALADLDRARSEFDRAYQVFVPAEQTIQNLVRVISEAMAAQMPVAAIIEILTQDDDKAGALAPLLVALRLEAGEDVRAPNEVLEVATDIRASWHGKELGQ